MVIVILEIVLVWMVRIEINNNMKVIDLEVYKVLGKFVIIIDVILWNYFIVYGFEVIILWMSFLLYGVVIRFDNYFVIFCFKL